MHGRMMGWLGLAGLLAAAPALAFDEAGLRERLQARLANDRSGACVLAAVIKEASIVRAGFCARPDATPPGFDSAFEIGSVSKTMTAFLVADLVAQGRWSLDDPIARHLPAGTPSPRFAGEPERQILVRDLLTHGSGLPALPARLGAVSEAEPYARLGEADLLASLGEVKLTRPIGSRSEYSNFGMMLVSLAVARELGGDLEAALRARLFEPLGMKNAYIAKPPPAAEAVQGHLPTGAATPAWTVSPNLAGFGMVRASLDDMQRYAQAQLLLAETPLGQRMRLTQQPLAHGYGMNWVLARIKDRSVVLHEGATGGFSSLLALDPAARRAVVLLADTSLANLGGLGDLGLPLLIPDLPLGKPRQTRPAPPELRQALAGDYLVMGTPVRIWIEADGRLMWQDPGQGVLELLYDSRGDFYPAAGSATLRPLDDERPVRRFVWRQGGGLLEGQRLGSPSLLTASNPLWKDWAGEYQIAPRFSLRVFEREGRLMLQGTGQPAIAAEVSGPDRIEVKAVGALLEFQRNDKGEVAGATLRQGGQVLSGPKAGAGQP